MVSLGLRAQSLLCNGPTDGWSRVYLYTPRRYLSPECHHVIAAATIATLNVTLNGAWVALPTVRYTNKFLSWGWSARVGPVTVVAVQAELAESVFLVCGT
jgi:hypothetical protein